MKKIGIYFFSLLFFVSCSEVNQVEEAIELDDISEYEFLTLDDRDRCLGEDFEGRGKCEKIDDYGKGFWRLEILEENTHLFLRNGDIIATIHPSAYVSLKKYGKQDNLLVFSISDGHNENIKTIFYYINKVTVVEDIHIDNVKISAGGIFYTDKEDNLYVLNNSRKTELIYSRTLETDYEGIKAKSLSRYELLDSGDIKVIFTDSSEHEFNLKEKHNLRVINGELSAYVSMGENSQEVIVEENGVRHIAKSFSNELVSVKGLDFIYNNEVLVIERGGHYLYHISSGKILRLWSSTLYGITKNGKYVYDCRESGYGEGYVTIYTFPGFEQHEKYSLNPQHCHGYSEETNRLTFSSYKNIENDDKSFQNYEYDFDTGKLFLLD